VAKDEKHISPGLDGGQQGAQDGRRVERAICRRRTSRKDGDFSTRQDADRKRYRGTLRRVDRSRAAVASRDLEGTAGTVRHVWFTDWKIDASIRLHGEMIFDHEVRLRAALMQNESPCCQFVHGALRSCQRETYDREMYTK
jgi:hypothetical protein